MFRNEIDLLSMCSFSAIMTTFTAQLSDRNGPSSQASKLAPAVSSVITRSRMLPWMSVGKSTCWSCPTAQKELLNSEIAFHSSLMWKLKYPMMIIFEYFRTISSKKQLRAVQNELILSRQRWRSIYTNTMNSYVFDTWKQSAHDNLAATAKGNTATNSALR